MKFSILISTKNRIKELLFTLNKSKLLFDENIECVVYDDGSTDNTFEIVKKNFPQIKLYRNEISKGYIFCRNKMLNETTADFAISLDDDANFLAKNPTQIIEDFFKNNKKCAVIAARIFWDDVLPKSTYTNQKSEIVQGFVGCGHVWRMKAWKEIPDYPEWYQFYGEENFASMQLFKKGWQIHYVPEILVHHRVNLKARSQSSKDGLIRYKNAIRADWFNYLLFLPTLKLPRKFTYSIWMQLKNKVFKGNLSILKPLFYAKFDIVKNYSKIKKNRNPFSSEQFRAYYKLTPTKIFWKPEK